MFLDLLTTCRGNGCSRTRSPSLRYSTPSDAKRIVGDPALLPTPKMMHFWGPRGRVGPTARVGSQAIFLAPSS
jgi:hypothetical protein